MNEPSELRASLERFFQLNPGSVYQATEDGGVIERPWADDTLQISVKQGDGELIESLNNIHLPPRFTAIWHEDTKDIEFIWGAVPEDNYYRSRSFEFRFGGKAYKCEFGDASARLLSVANAAKQVQPPTMTQHRNLPLVAPKHIALYKALGVTLRATSFWVHGIEWEEAKVIEFAQHLNFYISFYDASSPFILNHPPDSSRRPTGPPPPLPGLFPETIVGRLLDPNLLLLWEAAKTKDPFLQFLYLYQILEYAGFYHLGEEAATKVKRLLMLPDALYRVDETTRGVIDAVVPLQFNDPARMAAVVKLVIDPSVLWPIFERQASYFSSDVKFEGGFHLQPLLREGWGLADFQTGCFPQIAEVCRKIRNALAHAREKRMADFIAPTQHNAELLQPWLLPLRTIAAYAILYEDL